MGEISQAINKVEKAKEIMQGQQKLVQSLLDMSRQVAVNAGIYRAM
ncbi:hypothetical protein PP175_16200 [Aneurinibacillus sp. Ricciae_BoGa-3]|nr:hypothetical protein [Aneurinibacillus sp. Ricciae_BoGa-3]WCK52957.1 hypothetical protein PP175_16200 [Aneurinibacillus sp. Ricciae_BoGa-3]